MDAALVYARLALELAPDFALAQLLARRDPRGAEPHGRGAGALPLGRSGLAALLGGAAARGARARRARPHRRGEGASCRTMAAERPTRRRAADRARRHPARPQPVRRGGAAYDARRGAARHHRQAGHWRIFYSRGVALERSGQWPRAEADLKRALELQPDQPLVLNYLGYSWIDKGENLSRSAEDDRARGRSSGRTTATSSTASAGPITGSAIIRRRRSFSSARSSCCRRTRPSTIISATPIGGPAAPVEARYQWRRALQFQPEADEVKDIEPSSTTAWASPRR